MMVSYKIEWKKSAIKELKNLQKEDIPKIIRSVENLGSNPFPVGSKKLSGSENTYRIRIGVYRIIYQVKENSLIIQIVRVRHRKDAYRK